MNMICKIKFDKNDEYSGSEAFVGNKEQLEFRVRKLRKMGYKNLLVTIVH